MSPLERAPNLDKSNTLFWRTGWDALLWETGWATAEARRRNKAHMMIFIFSFLLLFLILTFMDAYA